MGDYDSETPNQVKFDLITVFGEIIPRLDERYSEQVLEILADSGITSSDDIELSNAVAWTRYPSGTISSDRIWTAHTAVFDCTPSESLDDLLPESMEVEHVQ